MENRKLNIAFFGSSLVSAYWNGAATYYRGIIRALHEKGYNITFYEPNAFDRQLHRDMQDPQWARIVIYEDNESQVLQMLQHAAHADIIIKASGVGVFDQLLEREVLNLKGENNLIIFWDVDAPATLDCLSQDPLDPFRKLVPHYDLVLTYGGGHPVANAYKNWGARECIPVYNALDTTTHFPVKADPAFQADLAFLGNRLPDREQRVEEFFLKPAQWLPRQQFILGGSGWKNKELTSNVKYLGHVYTKDHNSFNCTPKAVLNISRDSMARYGFSPATRVFEAAGAGACIITDYWEGIEQFLEPGHEVLVANNGHEVAQILSELTDEKASAIGRAAYQKVISAHTYAHRARQVDAIFKEYIFGQKIPL